MAFSKIIAFDRPLAAAVLPGRGGTLFTEAEVAVKAQEAYHSGLDAARSAADQQMVEFRSDMAQLSDGILKKIEAAESLLLGQLREALPGLVVEIARRLLADFEPPPEIVERLWRESLDQLYPEREGLELSLCPRDAELLERINPEWRQRYPGLRVRSDPELVAGDCLVRSRFGLTDARQQTKLATFQHALVGA